MADEQNVQLLALTAQIVSAFLGNNTLPPGDVPALIRETHAALARISGAEPGGDREPAKSKIPAKKSVTPDHIICLEDGQKFKSLKRHLRTHHKMTPEQYRAKHDLPPDYPMVASNYARARSELAKKMGLGTRREK